MNNLSDFRGRLQPQLLLLEDSETSIALIRDALAAEPTLRLEVVRTLAEAKDRLATMAVDLIIADLNLPDGKGTELLHQDGDEPLCPVIVLTGAGNEREAVEAMKAGAFDYLTKSEETLGALPHLIRRTLREWGHIIERRRAERALRAEEDRLRSFFQSSPTTMVVIAPDGTFLQVNPACCRVFGYREEELLRLTVREVTHPDDRAAMERLYGELSSGNRRLIEYEKRYLRRSGEPFWGQATVAGVYDPAGRLLYFAGQMYETTESRRAAAALRESEERFRSVFFTAAAGMVIIAPDGHILQANPAFCRFIGRSNEELSRFTIAELTHPADRDRTLGHYTELFKNQRQHLHYEKRYLRPDGEIVWGHASVACVMTPGAPPNYCVGLVQDITDRKQVEEALRIANRELDAFVHTVSHDLRSPLTPIIGYTDFLLDLYRDRLDDQGRQILGEIQRQGERMLALLEDLLALARVGQVEQPQAPVASRQVVDAVVVALADRILASGIGVQSGPLPPVRIPPTLLSQIFDNLIGNALRYAGQTGGVIEVGGDRERQRVRFFVRDHGRGIPAAERERIFELFYRGSTGAGCEGSGIGLATVHKIARLYHGRAWVEETPGGGSTFWVELLDDTEDSLSLAK